MEELFTVLTVSDFSRLLLQVLLAVPWGLGPKDTPHSVKLSKDVAGQDGTSLSDPNQAINAQVCSLVFFVGGICGSSWCQDELFISSEGESFCLYTKHW